MKRKDSSPSGFRRALEILALSFTGIGVVSFVFAIALINSDPLVSGAALAAAAVAAWGLIIVSAIRS